MIDEIKVLCSLDGPSGREDKVREYIKNRVKPFAADMWEDTMGNLYVLKKGKKKRSKPFMVCAHMDEVGMIIKGITEEGYLNFAFVGGVDKRVVIGKRVFVGEKRIPGIIGMKAVHLTTKEERAKTPKLTELCIDKLRKKGYNVYINRQVPTNDGGIALGQAYILSGKVN